ncbi:DUF2599 domain-containing protein [Pseudomonas costantinii]|uniref:DUF2599 domain-containing protein n=1 Tax=Pseudomonas costantinii TaxID=168469 RepID=UPI0015A366E5|nr:DUF2599 domain-containing protein [Pseudomonas costantinii]NVZ22130.1 DUF2599 domain-containing protein [Pseudomonas costantinii]NVZ70549.1 DUF2599 domain-containing protein [Pseudomonas costantinii]
MYHGIHSLAVATLTLTFTGAVVAAEPVLDPVETLNRINRNYNTLINDCKEVGTGVPRGLYYCSGVTLRMVNDGPFNPWDYSPYAIRLGATSYTWIRKDLSTNTLAHPGGFIMRNPTDAAALGRPVKEQGWTCIYAYDGGTGPERKWYGCGFFDSKEPPRNAQEPMSNRNAQWAYGTCAEAKVTTPEQWAQQYTGLFKNPIQYSQCSWNAEKPSDWNAMIRVHESRKTTTTKDPFSINTQFNEFMLKNASSTNDGSENMKYIDAFIYNAHSTFNFATRGDQSPPKPEDGLNSARSFQKKLYDQGYAVPILRLDFTAPPQQRFSYVAADQVIALGAGGGTVAQKYIASATWLERHDPGTGKNEWTLTVTPTAQGKAIQATDQQALYNELFQLRGADAQWRDNEKSADSMRSQLSCLIQNYPTKTVWNLEPFRPTVTPQEAAKAGCNPVAARPRYIASADWIKRYDPGSRKDEWTLSIVPTAEGRALPNQQLGALYDELYALKGNDPTWREEEKSAGSMRQQLNCVVVNYRSKTPWNLEPFRPAVSDAETKAAGCNPLPK